MIRHTKIFVDSDMQKAASVSGSLEDFAAQKLNHFCKEDDSILRIISIESSYGEYEMQPVLSDSSTWYTVQWLRLSVWYKTREVFDD